MMIDSNGELAHRTTAVFSSWVAHGVGAAVAFICVRLSRLAAGGGRVKNTGRASKPPLWSYLGGIPGAFTVILAGLALSGPLSLAGAIALMMVGQVIFSLACDHFGWLRVPVRRLGCADLLGVACVLAGSGLIIAGGVGR
ncbi:DMT family transporter [Paludibacterium yongneupense]